MEERRDILADLVNDGRRLLHTHEHATSAHRDFVLWDKKVSDWLDKAHGTTGLSAAWTATSVSPLVAGNQYFDSPTTWTQFRAAVTARLSFLAKLPSLLRNGESQASSSSPPSARAHQHDSLLWDVRQVCRNGHTITLSALSHPENLKKYCPTCGATTLTQCPHCDAEIQGWKNTPGVISVEEPTLPSHCHDCGSPYPWVANQNFTKAETHTMGSQPQPRVFVVHGHDDAMKEAVARLLLQQDMKPIILHEQPNCGRTLIEKFEAHASVDFAVVLMSPDDIGFPASDDSAKRARARQNVVLELGYFIGRLGRSRVCVLRRETDMELPTDVLGIVYTAFDIAGSWKMRLLTELRAAGFPVRPDALV